MGDNEPQEADGADDGGGNARQQHCNHRNDDTASCDVHAQRTGRFVLQRQQVALPHHKDGSDQTDDHIEQKRLKIIPGLHGDVGVDNAGNEMCIRDRLSRIAVCPSASLYG